MGIHQCISDQDAILIMLEDHLLLQDHAAHTVGGRRYLAGIKLSNVLVSVRTEIVALILVESQVEFRPVLDDRTVERRQQNMVVVGTLVASNSRMYLCPFGLKLLP